MNLSAAMPSGSAILVNPVQYMAQQREQALYWRTDTRWNATGAFMAYQLLCTRLNIEFNPKLLAYRYTDSEQLMNLAADASADELEEIRHYCFQRDSKRRFANELVKARESLFQLGDRRLCDPSISRGARVVFENRADRAPNRSLVLFGDEFSADSVNLLTGMLAETYAEVHFVWGAAIDYDYVDLVKPEVVITQGSEIQLFDSPTTSIDCHQLASESLQSLNSLVASNEGSRLSTAIPEVLSSGVSGSKPYLATSNVILPSERYTLDRPNLVQEHAHVPDAVSTMTSNDVVLHDIPGGKLYFTGRAFWLHDGNGNEVIKHAIPAGRKRPCWWRRKKKLNGTALFLASSEGAHCYYHWMLETLPKLGMLEREGISIDSIDYFIIRKITDDWQLQTLAALGIDKSRIIQTAGHFHWRADRLLHIDLNIGINLKMPKFIPQWIKHIYPTPPTTKPRIKLYITRPRGVRRRIANEKEIIPLLEQAGFTIMAMEGLSVADQAALMSRVDVIMSPHGGALSNMVFCRPGTSVVELFSEHVFPYYYGLAAICGHRYHAILENPIQDYPRLVDSKVAQSFADEQHKTVSSNLRVCPMALNALLETL